LAARAEILDGQQAETAARAFGGDGMMAALAIHSVWGRELPTRLTDVECGRWRAGGHATAFHKALRLALKVWLG